MDQPRRHVADEPRFAPRRRLGERREAHHDQHQPDHQAPASNAEHHAQYTVGAAEPDIFDRLRQEIVVSDPIMNTDRNKMTKALTMRTDTVSMKPLIAAARSGPKCSAAQNAAIHNTRDTVSRTKPRTTLMIADKATTPTIAKSTQFITGRRRGGGGAGGAAAARGAGRAPRRPC